MRLVGSFLLDWVLFPPLLVGLQMAPGEVGCCKAAVVKVECGGQAS